MTDVADSFWDFSRMTYAKPGVAKACLDMQDRHGLDVNMMLFCLFCADQGHALRQVELDRLTAWTEKWAETAVRPLRRIRRSLKDGILDPGDATAAEALRQDILALELKAEKIQQDAMEQLLPLSHGEAKAGLARANLARYCTADVSTLLAALGEAKR